MRNWNSAASIIFFSGKYRFYSTYEELKRGTQTFSNKNITTFLQYLWGIETYNIWLNHNQPKCVFTVPMRNWNFTYSIYEPLLTESFYSTYEELKLKQ